MSRKPCFLVLLALAVLVPALRADEVKLKGGRVVKGLIVGDDGKTIRIETVDGKVERFRHEDVEASAESAEVGNEAIDAKLKEVDTESAAALADTAKWAKDEGHKGWRLVAKLALKRDESNEAAHLLLDHVKVGDKWITNKAEAEKAQKEQAAKKWLAEGYIKYKDGFIKKEDRPLADKDPNAFMKDDEGVYREKSVVMKARGLTLIGGKWVKPGTEEDRADMAKFKELMGDDLWVGTSEHFRIFAQQYSPDRVDEFLKLCETIYAWFVKEMGKEENYLVFRGNKGMFWLLKDKATALEWYKHYRNKYSIDIEPSGNPGQPGSGGGKGQFLTLLERGGGNIHADGILIAIVVPDQNDDIRNRLAHITGHYLISWFSRGLKGTPSWLEEAFGHMAEHVHLGNGVVNCSTLAKYSADGGVAKKQFTTKDAKDRVKGLIREGSDEAFEALNKIELNQLDGDHLAKGWTIVEWLLRDRKKDFSAWLEGMNNAETMAALAKAFDGWSPAKLDEEWRKISRK